jgi:hypothetical protein
MIIIRPNSLANGIQLELAVAFALEGMTLISRMNISGEKLLLGPSLVKEPVMNLVPKHGPR